jgi:hypothetical protein
MDHSLAHLEQTPDPPLQDQPHYSHNVQNDPQSRFGQKNSYDPPRINQKHKEL